MKRMRTKLGEAAVVFAVSMVLFAGGFGCSKSKSTEATESKSESAESAGNVQLVLAYGSEKKTWLEQELKLFHGSNARTAAGKLIRVEARSMGSGEAVQDLVGGRLQAQVFSPASGAYVALLNDAWLGRDGHTKPLAPQGDPLILSPLVIAMWQPMATALGWPEKHLGWSDIISISKQPTGWASIGRPEWGRFKLGHAHPEYSNSGLLSVLAEAYAGAGKTRDLTRDDLQKPEVKELVRSVESSIVHYGKSTGLFADQMVAHGPAYLSAAVLYENLVIESRSRTRPGDPQLVSVYPVEGTFWSDHPFCVLDAPWVNAEQREAAQVLFAFLRSRAAQERALALGFRPADPAIAVASPIDAAHGADAKQPQTLLDVPDGATLHALLTLFKEVKKPSSVTLVFDKSGSMQGMPLAQAKEGAKAFLGALDGRDEASVTFFDGEVMPAVGPFPISSGRAQLTERIDGVIADGGTALYDAVSQTLVSARERQKKAPDRIHALVVMTDGNDENSTLALPPLISTLESEGSDRGARVFTIAYGDRAVPDVLKQIADAGGGTFAKGNLNDIVQVYRDIASFF